MNRIILRAGEQAAFRSVLRISAAVVFLLAATAPVFGAGRERPSMSLSVTPAKVWPGETCTLRIQIKNTDTDTPPDMDYLNGEFDVRYQGNEPMSHSIQITINGKTTVTEDRGSTFIYRLTPKRGGTIQIEPPIVKSDGVRLEASPVLLRVIEPEDQNLPPEKRNARLEVSVWPEKVYPLSPLTVTLSVYLREDSDRKKPAGPFSRGEEETPPQLLFDWGLDEALPQGLEPDEEFTDWMQNYISPRGGFSVNHLLQSNPFSIFGDSRRLLTFLPDGELIGTAGADGETARWWRYGFTRTFTAGEPGTYDFGPAILKGQIGGKNVYAATEPLRITVNEIPLPRPDGYIGVVGRGDGIRLDSRISSEKGRVGEALTYGLTLSGLKGKTDLQTPELENLESFKSRFKVYTPNQERTEETVRWTWNLRPLSPGDAPFPAVPLAYFDAAAGRFETMKTDEIPLKIEVGSADLDSFAEAERPTPQAEPEKGIYAPKPLGHMTRVYTLKEMAVFAGALYTALLATAGLVCLRRKEPKNLVEPFERRGKERLHKAFTEKPDTVRNTVTAMFLGPAAAARRMHYDALSRKDAETLLSDLTKMAPDGKLRKLASEFSALLDRMEEEKYAGGKMSVSEEEILALFGRWTAALKEVPALRVKRGHGAKTLGILLLTGLSVLTGCRPGSDVQTQFGRAEELFEQADRSADAESEKAQAFRQSAAVYEGLIAGGNMNGAVFYNLGCAYYRAGDLPRALLAWRRAERFMPADKMLKQNIAALKPKSAPEKKGVLDTVFFWRRFVGRPVQETVFFSLTTAAFAFTALSLLWPGKRDRLLRRTAAAALLVSLVIFGSLALDRRADARLGIITDETQLRKGNGSSYETIVELDALDECQILESHGGWFRIKAPAGQIGWVESDKTLTP